MPQVSTDWNYQGHHTRIESLSVEDRYEKCVVLTHWLTGMLQPQHPTGPYLSGADCTAWYASIIFVRKKRQCNENMMSQKQAHFPIISACARSHACFCRHLAYEEARDAGGAPSEQEYYGAVYTQKHVFVMSYMKIWRADCHRSIKMADKPVLLSSHQRLLLWLAEVLTLRVWLYLRPICCDKRRHKNSSATCLPPSCSEHWRVLK